MTKKNVGYKQGFFTPKFPEKYIGDVNNIVYRSGWEQKVMKYLDENINVLKWSSEEIVIPYISPIDNRPHRYFVDFYMEAIGRDGKIKKVLMEVKPHKQTQPPEKPKRKTKRYITEVMTYGVNQSKWEAAVKFCQKQGWEFRIISEQNLFPSRKNK